MNRQDIILRHIAKAGAGLEIGPSYQPIAPRREGYNVQVIDHLNREDLIRKYEPQGVDCSKIEEVDFVWTGERNYASLTGKRKYYDWIIASHVIEHTPDFIGFLNECDSVLKDDGVLSLAIPDKRYCFDHYRPITGISRVIDSHVRKTTVHTPGTIAEYLLNVVDRSGLLAWNPEDRGEYRIRHTFDETLRAMNRDAEDRTPIDAHAWCFVPHSFRLIVHDLFRLGLIPFKEVEFVPTVGNEFFVTLGRRGNLLDMPRLDLLARIESEIHQGSKPPRIAGQWRQRQHEQRKESGRGDSADRDESATALPKRSFRLSRLFGRRKSRRRQPPNVPAAYRAAPPPDSIGQAGPHTPRKTPRPCLEKRSPDRSI